MSIAVFDTYLKSYAKTRASEVSETSKTNFVSTDIAWGFFEQGIKLGEQEFKNKMKETMVKRFEEQTKSIVEVISQLFKVFKERNYTANKLFVALDVDCSKIILTLPAEQHCSDNFMNLFYPISSDLEDSHSKDGFNMQIFAIDESENINLQLLKSDGYSFGYDLINDTKLY